MFDPGIRYSIPVKPRPERNVPDVSNQDLVVRRRMGTGALFRYRFPHLAGSRDRYGWGVFVGIVQSGEQRLAKLAELSLILDFQAEDIFHVEDVHRPNAVGCDMRRRDLKTLLADSGGDIVQQARAIATIQFEHRVRI